MSKPKSYTEYKGYFVDAEIGTDGTGGDYGCLLSVKDSEGKDVDLKFWLGDSSPFLWTGFTPCLGAALAKAEQIVDELIDKEFNEV